MHRSFQPIWLVARRELRDQLRDWRILLPQIILVIAFPLLMNEVARETVAFVARYGANLIADRLIPFSILIIGFFPITISLVVALESFVGEKERGTIEPLLSSPIENWQMYFGKLLIGIATPLAASYSSITFYLVIVSRQGLQMPDGFMLVQLYMLASAHAVLMVSAAIVISVQSTSVRAANLLASFVVIPVAILMQGESALLFWGNNQVLWLAVGAVMIMSGLLIRVGIAHFQREYLLGREFDAINLRWIWGTFWNSFRGEAKSVAGWYRIEVRRGLRELAIPLGVLAVLAVAGYWGGYRWATVALPAKLPNASIENISKMANDIKQSTGLAQVSRHVSALYLLGNNMRATFVILLAGLISFSVLGVIAYLVNIGLIGGVLGMFKLIGYSPGLVLVAGLLPHGIFEIPALILAAASVLRIGVVLVTPQLGKSMGQIVIELLAGWSRIYLGLVVPLLVVAAMIESYLTPLTLAMVFNR